MPLIVGKVNKWRGLIAPECPRAVVAPAKCLVDDDNAACSRGALERVPEHAESRTTSTGNDQIGVVMSCNHGSVRNAPRPSTG